ncbi:Cutinase transcription factor 1 beta [Exophiala dermatitidis]
MEVTGQEISKKRRSAKACLSCRQRKVRCDFTLCGPPCTNCRLDKVACELGPNKRRRTEQIVPGNETTDEAAALVAEHPLQPSQVSRSPNYVSVEELQHATPGDPVRFSLPPEQPSARPQGAVDQPQAASEVFAQHVDLLPAVTVEFPASPSEPPSSDSAAPFSNDAPAQPLNLKPLSAALGKVDIDFLSHKGALTLPSAAFRNVCLSRYIEFVHTVLPVLDLDEFMRSLVGPPGGTGQGASLLLLTAVTFAAICFVEIEHVRAAGYSSKLAARAALQEKAELLFDLRAEDDKTVLIQSALLISTPRGNVRDFKDSWYWNGVAITLAQSLGLHYDLPGEQGSSRELKLKRRLWWCCYMREHVVAMGLGKPCRISQPQVPMIGVADCDLPLISSSAPYAHLLPRDFHSSTKLMLLSTLLVEKARLCVCIHRIVSTVYGGSSSHSSGEWIGAPDSQSPKSFRDTDQCTRDLDLWMSMLPHEVASKVLRSQDQDRSLVISKVTLQTIYYTAIIAVHRPQAFGPENSGTVSRDHFLSRARSIVRWAAHEISRAFANIRDQGLLDYLDATAVANLIAAIVVHLQDCSVSDNRIRRRALHDLRHCIACLRHLQHTYASAGHALKHLQPAARSAELAVSELDSCENVDNSLQPNLAQTSNVSYRDFTEHVSELSSSRGASQSREVRASNPFADLYTQALGNEWPAVLYT